MLALAACGRIANDPGDAAVADASVDVELCSLATAQTLFESADTKTVFVGLAIRSTDVLFVDGNTELLQSVPKNGGTATPLAQVPCSRFAVDGERAFCLSNGDLVRIETDQSATKLTEISLSASSIVAGGGHAYVADAQSIWSIDEATGTKVVVATAPLVTVDAFVEGSLYWRSDAGGYGNPNVSFNATDATTNATKTLATGSLSTGRMKVNSSAVYVQGYDPNAPPTSSTINLYVFPRGGGAVTTLVTNLYPYDFFVDDEGIVATNADGVTSYSLSGVPNGLRADLQGVVFTARDGPYLYGTWDDDFSAWVARACR